MINSLQLQSHHPFQKMKKVPGGDFGQRNPNILRLFIVILLVALLILTCDMNSR